MWKQRQSLSTVQPAPVYPDTWAELLTLALLLKPASFFTDNNYSLNYTHCHLRICSIWVIFPQLIVFGGTNIGNELCFSGSVAPHMEKKYKNHSQLTWHSFFTSGLSYGSFTWWQRLWWHPWVMTAHNPSQPDIVQYSKGGFGAVQWGADEPGKAEQCCGYFGRFASWSAWLPCCLFS